jgi:hypothetical protein
VRCSCASFEAARTRRCAVEGGVFGDEPAAAAAPLASSGSKFGVEGSTRQPPLGSNARRPVVKVLRRDHHGGCYDGSFDTGLCDRAARAVPRSLPPTQSGAHPNEIRYEAHLRPAGDDIHLE